MRDTIRNKIKLFFAFLIILFLLPYIISVFINGKNAVQGADSDNASVYLAGILAGETDGGYEIEALKAQAVVLRTELYRTEKEKQTILDKCLTQTQMKKKWGPKYEENLKKCQQAAQETKGIVLWYHETFAWAPFHQSSNGKTRDVQEVLGNADYPYITAKECPLDKAAEDEIRETICTGDQFRDALKLPSSSFSFYESPHGLKIATVGKGHGFGMSQWTAQEMAKDGKNYEEILQYFYEGTELHHIDE